MKKLLLVIAMTGCMAHGSKRVVEAPDPPDPPDPSVGDLRCQAPHITVSEWLYNAPGPAQCAEE